MNKEDETMIGFQIVAYAGDARTKLLNALQKAQNGEFEESEKLIQEAEECLLQAHKAQTEMIQKEAGGEDVELGFIMVHGQDHLMTTILLKELMKHLIELYKRGAK